jgi:hypothetical protein
MRNAYRILIGKSEEETTWGPRCRSEGNIKIYFREMDWRGDEVESSLWDRVQWRDCEMGNEPSGCIKARNLTTPEELSCLLRRNLLH